MGTQSNEFFRELTRVKVHIGNRTFFGRVFNSTAIRDYEVFVCLDKPVSGIGSAVVVHKANVERM